MKAEAIALHEAGHAVIAAKLGILGAESQITVCKDGSVEGSVEFSKDGNDLAWQSWSHDYTRKAVLAFLAGSVVSTKLEPGLDLLEEGGFYELDMLRADELATWLGEPPLIGDPPRTGFHKHHSMWREAVALVELNWSRIEAVAGELLKQRTMHGRDVEALLSPGKPTGQPMPRKIDPDHT